jgi:HD superfamily phosphohydrolase
MRDAQPWGLDSRLLETAKVITDPVHGDIFITELERRVIDSPPFQRLRRVKQLGNTHLVYPGATHTRFAHSLGSLSVAQELMDAVLDQELGPHPHPRDLFAEWREELGSGAKARQAYSRRVAEATVLARLGALTHDLTHVPFGHTIEDDLGLLVSHDENPDRLAYFWAMFTDDLRRILASDQLALYLRPLILSKYLSKDKDGERLKYSQMVEALGGEPRRAQRLEFVNDIVGNTICADLLDYLKRDHLNAGLPLAVGSRYLAYFYVTPSAGHHYYPARMVLRISRDGRPRADIVTELLKHLRYRYELSERALVHHAKLAADAMMGKALSMWHDSIMADRLVEALGRSKDDPSRLNVGKLQREAEDSQPDVLKAITASVGVLMEKELCDRGDDGLLEWLRDWSAGFGAAEPDGSDRRRAAVYHLTSGLLNRDLFKPIAHVTEVSPGPKVIYRLYSDPNKRRELEQAAAQFAEVDGSWKVLVWIPEPDMRLKLAEVLVDTGHGIRMFVDEESRGDQRGADIYAAHRGLWALSVFVEKSVREDEDKVAAVLAFLSSMLEVRIDAKHPGVAVKPSDAPDVLASRRVVRSRHYAALRGDEHEHELVAMLRPQRASRGAAPAATLSGRETEAREAADALLAARYVLKAPRFAHLRRDVAELYADVLQQSTYSTGSPKDKLRGLFRLVADARLTAEPPSAAV